MMEPSSGNNNKAETKLYEYPNGTVDFSSNGFSNHHSNKPRQYSLPSGTLNTGNNKIPLDRMSSVASSHYTTANSVLRLVNDDRVDNPHKRTKKCVSYCRLNKWALLVLLVLTLMVLTAMATLYAIEKQNIKTVEKIKIETSKDKKKPCFERATAMVIDNVAAEPEIVEAINKSTIIILKTFVASPFQAFSVNVYYMGEKIYSKQFAKNKTTAISQDTPFPIASVSKIFTVLMLEILVEKGTIKSLDDDVSIYEPSFKYKDPFHRKKITFRHLACMMSGLPRESPCRPYRMDNFCPHSSDEMFQRIKNISLTTWPGHVPSYSNLAVSILGRVLERQLKNNETFEEWVKENILEPLNMTNTGFDILKRNDFPVSVVNGKISKAVNWGWLSPTAGMYSSAADLAKLGQLFAADSKTNILSKKAIQRLLKPEYIWSDGNAQGCPFEIIKMDPSHQKKIGYMIYTKDGSVFGYGTKFSLIPDMKLNINVLVAHPDGSSNPLWSPVTTYFLDAFDKLLKRKGENYSLPPNPEYFVGSYRLISYWPLIQKPCNITLEDNTLFLNLEWMKAPLTRTENNYVLKTGNFNKLKDNHMCQMLGLGLLRMKFHFDPPSPMSSPIDGNTSNGFHVNDISFYGYVRFDKIK